MPDISKEQQIFDELRRRAKEDIRFGSITVKFKIQDGKIMGGDIVEKEERLG